MFSKLSLLTTIEQLFFIPWPEFIWLEYYFRVIFYIFCKFLSKRAASCFHETFLIAIFTMFSKSVMHMHLSFDSRQRMICVSAVSFYLIVGELQLFSSICLVNQYFTAISSGISVVDHTRYSQPSRFIKIFQSESRRRGWPSG